MTPEDVIEGENATESNVNSGMPYSLWQKTGALCIFVGGRLHMKCDGTRWRAGGEVKRKLTNAVGSQYPSHHLRTWCIQHYYRWWRTPRLPAVDWTDATHRPILMDSFRFARKTKSGFCACAITFQLSCNIFRDNLVYWLRYQLDDWDTGFDSLMKNFLSSALCPFECGAQPVYYITGVCNYFSGGIVALTWKFSPPCNARFKN